MKKALLIATIALASGLAIAQATYPWPSDHVRGGVRDWFNNNPDEAFQVVNQALIDMDAHANTTVNNVGIALRDKLAESAGLIDAGGDVTQVEVYKEEFERIMRIIAELADPDKMDEIRTGIANVLKTEFEPKPTEPAAVRE